MNETESFPRPWRVERNPKNGLQNIVVAANGRLVAEPLPIDGATVEDCEAVAAEIAAVQRGETAMSQPKFSREDKMRLTLNVLEIVTRQMRKSQKEYFRTRSSEALRLAKECEKHVDELLDQYDELYNNKPVQGELL